MKTFEAWLAEGLVGEFFTVNERTLMKIAYLEGAGAAIDANQAKLASLFQGLA